MALAGLFIGGLIGYLTRPSIFLIGQLPFGIVITRGAALSGLDEILRSSAENAFNHMMGYAIAGALVGGVGGALIKMLPASRE